MYYILYEHDHANRAKALDGNLPNRQLIEDPVVKVPYLKTLIIWGHGSQGLLCKLPPAEMALKLKAWKAKNSGIDTVEILTCNSRHATAGSDSYVESLKQKLGFFDRRRLTIKSLPVRMGVNGRNGDSILFADYKSKTWCYLTDREQTFHFMRNVFKSVCENVFDDDAAKAAVYLTSLPSNRIKIGDHRGSAKIGPFLAKCKVGSVAALHTSTLVHGWSNNPQFMATFCELLAVDSFRSSFVSSRTYTMNYGTFDHLRKSLVTV